MIETPNLHKFKFEYDDSEESQFVRKLYGNRYLQETNGEEKQKLKNLIIKLYNNIEDDKSNYERYMQRKTKQYVLTEDDINKAKNIISINFKGMKATDGSEFYNNEDFINRQFEKVVYNINRPRLGYTGKTHYGPLHSYSNENLKKLFEIFGRKIPIFKWNLN
jgi:hypothetical protein